MGPFSGWNGVLAKVARILGIDLGERRIGIAISTPEGGLAVPLRILDATNDEADAQAITDIAKTENATRLVIGHPISMDGSVGPQASHVETFARRLRAVSGLPVELCDERLSSAQARRTVKRGKPVDDVAASIILQSYLDKTCPERS